MRYADETEALRNKDTFVRRLSVQITKVPFATYALGAVAVFIGTLALTPIIDALARNSATLQLAVVLSYVRKYLWMAVPIGIGIHQTIRINRIKDLHARFLASGYVASQHAFYDAYRGNLGGMTATNPFASFRLLTHPSQSKYQFDDIFEHLQEMVGDPARTRKTAELLRDVLARHAPVGEMFDGIDAPNLVITPREKPMVVVLPPVADWQEIEIYELYDDSRR